MQKRLTQWLLLKERDSKTVSCSVEATTEFVSEKSSVDNSDSTKHLNVVVEMYLTWNKHFKC